MDRAVVGACDAYDVLCVRSEVREVRLVTVNYVCVLCFTTHGGALYDAEHWLFGINQRHYTPIVDATCYYHMGR